MGNSIVFVDLFGNGVFINLNQVVLFEQIYNRVFVLYGKNTEPQQTKFKTMDKLFEELGKVMKNA